MKLGCSLVLPLGIFLAIGTLLICHMTGAALTFKMGAKKVNVEKLHVFVFL